MREEGLDRPATTPITWLVDPIDATVNYLYDHPAYAVSVAAVVGDPRTEGAWRPVAGAIHNPVLDELFTAGLGAGAHLHSPRHSGRITANPAETLGQSLVATGFAYDAGLRARQGEAVARLLPLVRDIRRSGCAALDFCYAALGRVDAYYESNLQVWDYAAGWLVATEAGCTVQGLEEPHPTQRFTVVGSHAMCDELKVLVGPPDSVQERLLQNGNHDH